ncbi:hypothetical protein KW796_01095 [Candidatus Parcubacteria bacterium]|nr:hypothetical protein [Candidatus Parcubacteria bacterium]
MDRNLLWAVMLFGVQLVNYFFLRPLGIYSRFWYADIVLHILAGIMFGCLWLWFSRKLTLPREFLYSSIIMSAVLGSFLWEVWEFGGWYVRGFSMPYYIPSLGDTLSDILAGMVGAIILCLVRLIHSLRVNFK